MKLTGFAPFVQHGLEPPGSRPLGRDTAATGQVRPPATYRMLLREMAAAQLALGQLVNRRRRWMTLVVILACATTIRLGFWQLDRLAQRRAFNAELAQRFASPPVVLGDQTTESNATLEALAYRPAVAQGTFDYAHEVALVNQVWQGQLGLHLITPLQIHHSDHAVLVDRGWIPATAAAPERWTIYRAPEMATISGWLRLGRPARNTTVPTETRRLIADLDVARLESWIGRPLLRVILDQAPANGDEDRLPHRIAPAPSIGDGVHLIVALQWFAFSVIIGVGYVAYVVRNTEENIA